MRKIRSRQDAWLWGKFRQSLGFPRVGDAFWMGAGLEIHDKMENEERSNVRWVED